MKNQSPVRLSHGPIIGYVICAILVLIKPAQVTSFHIQPLAHGRIHPSPPEPPSSARSTTLLHSTRSTSEAYGNLESAAQSYLTFKHPETNTEVTLIGCLHGSPSSAKDVSDVLHQSTTDVVVLELCPTRYKDLMKEVDRRKSSADEMKSSGSYLTMVRKTIEARGVSTGIAAAVLGGASGISTFFSGFDPGLEFITAMEYVDEKSRDSDNDVDVILADRMVDETLRRVGALPTVSFEMFQAFVKSGFSWKEAYGKDATILSNAVAGSGEFQLDMGKALMRNKAVIADLIRLTLPVFLLVEVVNILIGIIFDDFVTMMMAESNLPAPDLGTLMVDLASTMTTSDWGSLAGDVAFEIVSSCIILFLGYVLLALPTSRIILSERDDQLAKGIEDACKFASEKRSGANDDDNGGRVVCVLGFLHVNGVAKKLAL